ncbi:hypothetical protein BKA62DRAFT_416106 [Auriculariales sp. MPI-PUGE-AT-0066]|nr:hypothetical protein BKA62DRAFT_416106 [Auriculariales sp. MPI-PUGE-AT-0066]
MPCCHTHAQSAPAVLVLIHCSCHRLLFGHPRLSRVPSLPAISPSSSMCTDLPRMSFFPCLLILVMVIYPRTHVCCCPPLSQAPCRREPTCAMSSFRLFAPHPQLGRRLSAHLADGLTQLQTQYIAIHSRYALPLPLPLLESRPLCRRCCYASGQLGHTHLRPQLPCHLCLFLYTMLSSCLRVMGNIPYYPLSIRI